MDFRDTASIVVEAPDGYELDSAFGHLRNAGRITSLEARYSEIFSQWFFDAEILGVFSYPMPIGVEEGFREALPDLYRDRENFRLGLHPWLKRICLWQRQRDDTNSCWVWGVALIFQGACLPGYLPKDIQEINHDGRYDSWVGQIGDFVAPNVGDFAELAALADNQRPWRRGERARLAYEKHAAPRRSKKRSLASHRGGFFEYYRHLFGAAANERAGSMQGLPIMGTADPKEIKEIREARAKATGKNEAAPDYMLRSLPTAFRNAVEGDKLLAKTRKQIPYLTERSAKTPPILPIPAKTPVPVK